ncbi:MULTISPECIES: hypothetical protein [Bacillus cereus group]|uniref:hypothetical protein n=1 Tax=Bacillus cereus group TaxID=86661 RepID=UPI0002EFCA11|nr:hypothetical protein [Bacillus anthracis]MEC4693411.1 hypothetical protein [Bacillus anthracis]
MGIIVAEMKKGICNKMFLLSILLGIIMICYSAYTSLKPYLFLSSASDITESQVNLLKELAFNRYEVWVYGTDFYVLISPLLACLAYSTSYRLDIETNFINCILVRTKKKYYQIAKISATALSGALSVSFPLILFIIIISIFLQGDITKPLKIYPFGILSEIYNYNPNQYILFFIVVHFVFGAVYSIFSLALSSVIKNRLIALITPLIFLYVGTITFHTIGLPRFSPGVVNSFYQMKTVTLLDITLHLLGMLIISLGVFFISSRKELEEI